MKRKDLTRILIEEIDNEILEKMPEWFRILKKAYENLRKGYEDFNFP